MNSAKPKCNPAAIVKSLKTRFLWVGQLTKVFQNGHGSLRLELPTNRVEKEEMFSFILSKFCQSLRRINECTPGAEEETRCVTCSWFTRERARCRRKTWPR